MRRSGQGASEGALEVGPGGAGIARARFFGGDIVAAIGCNMMQEYAVSKIVQSYCTAPFAAPAGEKGEVRVGSVATSHDGATQPAPPLS